MLLRGGRRGQPALQALQREVQQRPVVLHLVEQIAGSQPPAETLPALGRGQASVQGGHSLCSGHCCCPRRGWTALASRRRAGSAVAEGSQQGRGEAQVVRRQLIRGKEAVPDQVAEVEPRGQQQA